MIQDPANHVLIEHALKNRVVVPPRGFVLLAQPSFALPGGALGGGSGQALPRLRLNKITGALRKAGSCEHVDRLSADVHRVLCDDPVVGPPVHELSGPGLTPIGTQATHHSPCCCAFWRLDLHGVEHR